ncbi:hypothetical protein BVX93_00445, partial [bacterium B13(2017)]
RVEIHEYLLNNESGYDGYLNSGQTLILDQYGHPKIDLNEWVLKSGKIINQSRFSAKGSPKTRETFEYLILRTGEKRFSKGEIKEYQFDVHGNIVEELSAHFALSKTEDYDVNLEQIGEILFSELSLSEQTAIVQKINEFVNADDPNSVNTKVLLNNGVEIDIKDVGGVFYDALSIEDQGSIRGALRAFYLEGGVSFTQLETAFVKEYKLAEAAWHDNYDGYGNAHNSIRQDYIIIDRARIFVKGRLNLSDGKLNKDVYKVIGGEETIRSHYNFRNLAGQIITNHYMIDYSYDMEGQKIYYEGQQTYNEYDPYGTNLTKRTNFHYDLEFLEQGSMVDINNYARNYTLKEVTHFHEYGFGERVVLSETEYWTLNQDDPSSDGYTLDENGNKIFDESEFTHVW